MDHGAQRSMLRMQTPLAFDLCLKALRGILKREKFGIVLEVLCLDQPSRTGGESVGDSLFYWCGAPLTHVKRWRLTARLGY